MQDRRSVRGALLRGSPVEVVVEDGFDRAISACADVDGALGGGFEALGATRTGQPDVPQTGAKALFPFADAVRGSVHTAPQSQGRPGASARMRSIVHPTKAAWPVEECQCGLAENQYDALSVLRA